MAVRQETQTMETEATTRPAAMPGAGRAGREEREDAARTGTSIGTPIQTGTWTSIETRIEECLGLLRQQMRKSDPQELDATLDLFQKALRRPAASRPSAKADLVRQLSGGRTYTPAQAAALELRAAQDAFARRRQLLASALTAPEAARLLGTTRQTPHDRAGKGALLAIMDQGRLLFPAWQFDPDGPNGVLAGLPDVLRALDASLLGKASWLMRANPYLEGRTPLQALREGDLERVLDQARAVGAL